MKYPHLFASLAAFLFVCGGIVISERHWIAALGALALGAMSLDMTFYAVRREGRP